MALGLSSIISIDINEIINIVMSCILEYKKTYLLIFKNIELHTYIHIYR